MTIQEAARQALNQDMYIRRSGNPFIWISVDECMPADVMKLHIRYVFSKDSIVWKASADDVLADDWEVVDPTLWEPPPKPERMPEPPKPRIWNRSYWIPVAITMVNLILIVLSISHKEWFG